ncbi:MAG: phosphoribosylglycinamide formyltransferase [Clostridia bacterium]
MLRIAVFVSGSGSNLQALIDAKAAGKIAQGEIALVLSNFPEAYALRRAKNNNIPIAVVRRQEFSSRNEFETTIEQILNEYKIDLIVFAGFLAIVSVEFVQKYKNKIINVHPSLLPAFGGKGMYGINVHKAVLAQKVETTGATVHFVNEITDGGEILAQLEVPVLPFDTPEILQKRVLERAEWIILPQVVERICQERS